MAKQYPPSEPRDEDDAADGWPTALRARPNATLKSLKKLTCQISMTCWKTPEIKSIGDNVKSLKNNVGKNLADVREIAQDASQAFAASEQFKKDMEALTAGMLEKHDAIALKVKALTEGALKASTERMDDIEKKLTYLPTS
jgi:hypothetical protein